MLNIFKNLLKTTMEVTMRMEGCTVPRVQFAFREGGEFIYKTTKELFSGKRVVIFALPGAFTPTCSNFMLPKYEEMYDTFKSHGIDEIYCISVNDAFVMNAWAKDQNIEKVKLIPDGNGDFTGEMGMLVNKSNLGFGERSWRYAALVNDRIIEKLFVEPGLRDNADTDPYEVTTPENVLNYIRSSVLELELV
jgi:peroxiredoxin